MPKRKSGWEQAKELEKKRDEADQLKKTHKVTSFLSVLKNDATGATTTTTTDDSPSVSEVDRDEEVRIAVEAGLADTVEGRAKPASGTIPDDVGFLGDIMDHLREMCISLGASHFRHLVDS